MAWGSVGFNSSTADDEASLGSDGKHLTLAQERLTELKYSQKSHDIALTTQSKNT